MAQTVCPQCGRGVGERALRCGVCGAAIGDANADAGTRRRTGRGRFLRSAVIAAAMSLACAVSGWALRAERLFVLAGAFGGIAAVAWAAGKMAG